MPTNNSCVNKIFMSNSFYTIFVIALLIFTSCTQSDQAQNEKIIEGYVTNVSAANLLTVDWFEIETNSGELMRFEVKGSIGSFTPSHMRQHMLIGDPVVITYYENGEKFNASMVEDIESQNGRLH